jgi:hypothetical protein
MAQKPKIPPIDLHPFHSKVLILRLRPLGLLPDAVQPQLVLRGARHRIKKRNIALKKVLTLPFDHDNFICGRNTARLFSDGPYYQPLFDSTRRFPGYAENQGNLPGIRCVYGLARGSEATPGRLIFGGALVARR